MKLSDITSAGLRSDIEMILLEGNLSEREEYLRVETPKNPQFYWGNFLIFQRAPTKDDVTRWQDLFLEEFRHQPRVRHCLFAWDSEELGAADAFKGFEKVWTDTLTLTPEALTTPSRLLPELLIRPLRSDDDWNQAIHSQVASRGKGFSYESHLEFKTAQFAAYRRLAEAGVGAWYGAFLGDKLVGDCGLYHLGPYGRFQAVETHPDYRGRGVCSTLIHHVARQGLQRSSTLVICADPDYHAIRLYEGVGFRRQKRTLGIMRRPAGD